MFERDLPACWKEAIRPEVEGAPLKRLLAFLEEEKRLGVTVYPKEADVLRVFSLLDFNKVKVVIVGQDPYHGPGQAHGLSFSVPKGVPKPPSLMNIFKELYSDLGIPSPDHGCLESWVAEGVLLLNATLTVREGLPKSHYGRGWEHFTDGVIKALLKREEPLVFILWGKSAQEKCAAIANSRHVAFRSVHPSPLSAYGGFFGSKPFSKTNEQLKSWGKEPVNWANFS